MLTHPSVVALALTAAAASGQVRLFDLPIPGAEFELAAMSEDGTRIVVHAGYPGTGAWRWDGVGYQPFPSTGRMSIAGASDDLSVVAGTSYRVNQVDRGVLFSPTGTTTFEGPDGLWLDAVSGDGRSIAGRSFGPGPGYEVNLWRDGVRTAIAGPDLGGRIERVAALSSDGRVALGTTTQISNDAQDRAWLWDAAGGYTVLPHLNPGDWSTQGLAVSSDGSTAAGHSFAAFGEAAQGWIWSDGSMHALTGDGFSELTPLALSRDGSVATGFGRRDGVEVGFVWTEQAGATAVADLLAAEGVDMTGFMTVWMRDISPDGTILGGTLVRVIEGQTRTTPFTLTIPAPAGLMPLAGLVALARRRR